MNREELMKLYIESLPANSIAVEIGTDGGYFSEQILSSNQTITLYCIDPYLSYDDYKDAINFKTGDLHYENTKQKLKNKFGDRVQFIRKFSSQAIHDLSTIQIDFLYIDGNHSYKYVLEDLINYFPLVKSNGIIIGDDAVDLDDSKRDTNGDILINWSHNCFGYYGVVKAFNTFCQNNNIQGQLIGNQFLIKK